jgi:hypothetical protein
MAAKRDRKPAGRATQHDPKAEAQQAREARESQAAHNAQASNRERMVDIGRANKQAGRQTKS